jgi:hypothetical protein
MTKTLTQLIEEQRQLCKYFGEDTSLSERILSVVYQFGQTFKVLLIHHQRVKSNQILSFGFFFIILTDILRKERTEKTT